VSKEVLAVRTPPTIHPPTACLILPLNSNRSSTIDRSVCFATSGQAARSVACWSDEVGDPLLFGCVSIPYGGSGARGFALVMKGRSLLCGHVKQAMAESAKIFIHYLTATANDACRDSKRSTISADDVLRAVEDIEFADFVPPLQASLEGFKREHAQKKAAAGKRKAKDMCVACAPPSRHPWSPPPSATTLCEEHTNGCSYDWCARIPE
jgi:hypothetical protein